MSTKQLLVSFDQLIIVFKFSLRALGVLPSTVARQRLFATYFVVLGSLHISMYVVDMIVKRSTAVEAIYETVASAGIHTRYYILLANRREFSRMIDACAELWHHCDVESRSLVRDCEQKIRVLFWMIFGSIEVGLLLYSFNAVNVSYLSKESANASRILPFRWFGVEDAESVWPGYKITFALQLLVISNVGVINAAVDSALPLLMILCCGYFKVLCRRLENIKEKTQDDPILADLELVDCCKFHQKILDLCWRVEKFGRLIFLIELATSGYTIALAAFKLAKRDADSYRCLPIIAVMIVHILICQWAPDLLMNEGNAVSTAAYSVSCTFMKRPSSRHLVIMILKAQQPLIMTAGGIVILSLQNFVKMMTRTVSFFTAMRNLMD